MGTLDRIAIWGGAGPIPSREHTIAARETPKMGDFVELLVDGTIKVATAASAAIYGRFMPSYHTGKGIVFLAVPGVKYQVTAAADATNQQGKPAGIVAAAVDGEHHITFAGAAVAGTLATGAVADNNALTWTAKVAGAVPAYVRILDPGGQTSTLAVDVTGPVVTVTLGRADGALTSTAADVIAAIEAFSVAAMPVTVVNTGASTGAGVMAAVAETPLAGGVAAAQPFHLDSLTPFVVEGATTEVYVVVPPSKSQAMEASATALPPG